MRTRLTATMTIFAGLLLCAGPAGAESLPAPPDISGAWQTSFADLYIIQEGTAVTGYYDFKGGMLSGTLAGSRLDYAWRHDGKSGKGYFIISDDGQGMQGRYGYGEDNSGGGPWTARSVRALVQELRQCQEGTAKVPAAASE